MVLEFEQLSIKQQARFSAFKILKEQELFNAAVQLIWTIVREKIFDLCTQHDCLFSSTEEAILHFTLYCENSEQRQSVQRLYIISTLVEFDQNFYLTVEGYHKIEQHTLSNIIKPLDYAERSTS